MCDPLPSSPRIQTLIQELVSSTDSLEREQLQAMLINLKRDRLIATANGNRQPICPVLRPVSARLHLMRLG